MTANPMLSFGGSAANTDTSLIPLHEPLFRGNEWAYVKACLDSGWVSSAGPMVDQFERVVADFVGARHGVATVNGTAALHTALKVAGVGRNDEVVVPALTFIAPVNSVAYCGAYPVFMDSDVVSWNMDPAKTVDFLDNECAWRDGALRNRRTGRRIAAILPVHILGHPVDLIPIVEMARKYQIPVIEDASESLGALYNGRSVGVLGDISCFSFNGNKVITTGGGGMIVTNREEWAVRARYLTTHARCDSNEYVHDDIGYNYRLPNLNAALGVAQMEQLSALLAAKRNVAEFYRETFRQLEGVSSMPEAPWARAIYWLFTVLLKPRHTRSRSEILAHLRQCRVQARPLWVPMHRLRLYQHAQTHHIEWADRLYELAISLPSSAGLRESDQREVVAALVKSVSPRANA